MNLQELKNLKIWDAIYADAPGIVTNFLRKNVVFKTSDVPKGAAGFIQSIDANSITIAWDHYSFEDHVKQELLPNPITVLEFKDLGLVRVNRFPPNVRYC